MMIYNFIWDYIPITFQITGYLLLLIAIYCCYEAYYKIKRNKGYIYIAIICFLMLLPSIINIATSMFGQKVVRVEPNTQRTAETSIESSDIRYEEKHTVLHFPLVELFLLLALLKFSFKEEKDNPNQTPSGNPAPPSS